MPRVLIKKRKPTQKTGSLTKTLGTLLADSMAVMVLQVTPRLPALMDTTYAAPGGSTIVVGDGGNFQTALNNAARGDTITLNAGSSYTGNFTLPDKGVGTDYIYIRSSAALTAEGTRITTGQAASFPKIATSSSTAAIQAAAGASYYRFINCEIKSGATQTAGLVLLGSGEETDANDFPHHIILDRCYVHGHATNGGKRGVMFSGDYQAVIDSYLSDWKGVGQDTQAICGWTGHGPYKIVNNYIEGAGENVMFGGADTAIANLTPSDIEVRGNYFFKPLSWKVDDPSYAGTHWLVKNIFELKHAQRALVDDNIFENCWADGQNGYGIVFTVRNEQGTNPWATVSDVTFRNNTIRHCANGVNLLGRDFITGIPSDYAKRLLIERNLFYDIGLVPENSDGIFCQIPWRYDDVGIDHNTVIHTGSTLVLDGLPSERFKLTNNITLHNSYGIMGSGYGSGNASIAQFLPGADIRNNVIVMNVEDFSGQYPADNFYPLSLDDVGFVALADYADLRLTEVSDYHNAALDGTDLGADMATPA